MEAQLSAHIRHLLLDYVQCHITTDYVQFTEAAVAELVSLEQVPEYDPASLTLPSDPYTTLSHLHNLKNLSLHEEKFVTTQDALQLLRKSIAPPKGQPKSECLSWGRDVWDDCQNDAFYRVESILTRRALRETPVLGKSGGARRARGMQKVELDSYARLMASKPIMLKAIDVEPVEEPQVKLNKVLDVVYNLKATDHAAVRTYLQSVATMCRPQPPTPNDIKKDYRRAYLPAGFVFDPPRPATPPPDSPPLTPIFARSARYKCAENRDVKNGVLRSYAELPEHLGAAREAKIPDLDADMDLARASMIVVDGWQTYAVSSPTTVSSADEDFDELVDMFPSSPDTSVAGVMNLVEDVENLKLDEIQIPKSRRIGGSLGLPKESIVDKARKAGGLGAFLLPLLKPSDSNYENTSTFDLHPLLHDKMSTLSGDPVYSKSTKKEGKEEPPSKISEPELDSMCGQASAASSLGEGTRTEEDNEIRALYLDLSHPEERRLGPPLPRELQDPKALIRDEPLFEETNGVKEKGLTLKLMPVPVLPDPNVGVERGIQGYLDYLVGRDIQRDVTGNVGKRTSPLRFLKNTKGMAPLRVALSWVPFTCTTPIPVHAGLLQNDLEVGEAVKTEVDTLLKQICTRDDAGAGGCGFGDELRWRTCSGQHEERNEFSEEIAKCEIILTRKERKALLARERGVVGACSDSEVEKGSEDAGDEESEKRIEMVNEAKSSEPNGSRITKQVRQRREQDENEDDHRPVKRARISVDDSGVGMMLELDGPFHDFDGPGDQDESFDTTDNMLQDTYQDDNDAILNSSKTNYDGENIQRTTGTVIGTKGYDYTDPRFTNTDDDNSEMIAVEDEPPNQGQQGSSESSESMPLSNGSSGHYARASRARFNFAENSDAIFHQGRTSEGRDHGNAVPRMTMDLHVPHRVVAIDNGQRVAANDEGSDQSRSSTDTSLKKLNLDLASHSLGIEGFARLRAKTITNSVPLPTDKPTETANTRERNEPLTRILPRTTPTELYDDKTVRIPSHPPRPQTIHKYMASVDLLQKQVLVRSLSSRECLVELVERNSLGGADLIIDPYTAVIFTCLLSLPARCNRLLERLSAQSWRYKRVLIVFEAYPESRSFRQRQKQGLTEPEPELYAYTPPIVKAIKRFRRDLAIAEGCGKKSTACDVWGAFANSVSEAAACARLFGDEAERADCTFGALWGNRVWLDADESEDEKDLASISGMNCFSAAVVLCQMTLQQFLDVTPEDRLAMVGPLIGNEAVTAFNLEIGERMRVMYEDPTHVMSCA